MEINHPDLMTYDDYINEFTEDAKLYHQEKLRLGLAARFLPGLIMIVLIFLGFPAWINTFNPLDDTFFGRFLMVVYFMITFAILQLPFSLLSERLERKYEFSTRSNRKLVKDIILSFILLTSIVGFAVAGIFEWIENLGSFWWFPTFLATLVFIAILLTLMPVLIIPLFTRMESLEEGSLRTRMENLADNMQVGYKDIYLWKLSDRTKKPNAAVMGFGSTLRIVLGDTMTQHFREDEMEVVMCHEIGHYKHKDVYRGTVVTGLFFLVAYLVLELAFDTAVDYFGYPSRASAETIPFFLVSIGLIQELSSVFFNWYIRGREKAADILAIATLRDVEIYESAFARLAKRSLSYPNPSKLEVLFWYDHPPIRDRVAYAKKYMQSQN